MSHVFPFKALHFNSDQVKDIGEVIIPPYDAIPEEDVPKYLAKSPYNFAHVLLPRSANEDYSHALQLLTKWRETGILRETSGPCYFLYEQKFEAYGSSHSRRVLMCTVELCDFSKGIVRPHENTYGQYKADRLAILKKTQCNLSHIFGMVRDQKGTLESLYEKWVYEKPFLKGNMGDGVEHAVWKIEASKAPEIQPFFEDHPIYIVDGHHRYESSLMYAKELGVVGNRNHPASQMLFAIANAYDPGLVVFPTHRMVRKGDAPAPQLAAIEKRFQLEKREESWLKGFVDTARKDPNFALYMNGVIYEAIPKNWVGEESKIGKSVTRLGVTWSDHYFLKENCGVDDSNRKARIHYERDLKVAWRDRDKFQLVVFQPRPNVTDVSDVADEKLFMPQKSTYFFPKLAAGLVMRRH